MFIVALLIICTYLLYRIKSIKLKDFGDKKILILGNSPNIKEHRLSNIIDSGEFTVIRFNNWKLGIEESKNYSGTQVDFTYQNNVDIGLKFFNSPNENIIMSNQNIFNNILYTFISEIFTEYSRYYIISFPKDQINYSNGLRMIFYFLNRGVVPYIHGFTLDDNNSRQHLYEEKEIFKKIKRGREKHDFNNEKVILSNLLKEGKIKMLKDYNE